MARLSAEQWEKVKADYVTGRYSTRELAQKHGVSNAAISQRAKKETWEKIEQQLIDKLVDAHVTVASGVEEVAKLNKLNAVKFTDSISELAQFEIESNKIMKRIDEVNLSMLHSAENPNQVKAIMETHIKHREARLGKNPETAIQINQQEMTPPVIKIIGRQPSDRDTSKTV